VEVDLTQALRVLQQLVERLVTPDLLMALPAQGELTVWVTVKKPELHLPLGTVMYRLGRTPMWSDLMPHPNLLTYVDDKWRKKNGAVIYAVVRAPNAGGGIGYHVIDPSGGIESFAVATLAARVQFFMELASSMTVKAETWRRLVDA